MDKLKFLHLPFREDKVFGFLFLIFILCTLTIITVFSEPIDSPRLFIWSALLGVGIIFWLRQQSNKIYLDKTVAWVLLGLVIWSVIATIFSIDRINSLVGVNIRMTSSLWFFVVWAATIFLLSSLSKQKLLAMLKLTSYLVGVISFWAILQNYGIGFYEGMNPDPRALIPSFLGNPNFAAMFVGSAMFVNFWYLFTTENKVVRLLQLLFIGFSIYALMIFASRGALLGVVTGFAILTVGLLIKKQWRYLAISGGVFVLIIISSLGFLQAIRSETLTSLDNDQSAAQRWYAWDNAFTEIKEKPLVGSGLGNYFISYRQNQDSHLANINWFDDPHNLILHLAVNGGLPLAILFVLLYILAFRKLVKRYFQAQSEVDLLNLFLIAALASWLVAAQFNPVSVANWLLLVFILAAAFHTDNNFFDIKNKLARRGTGVLAVILIGGGVAFILSEIFLWQAIKLNEKDDVKAETLATVSITLNPTNLVALNQLAMSQFINNKHDEIYQTLQATESLHPLSAGVYQQTLTGYMNLYKKTNDEKYKQQVYSSMDKYRNSFPNHQFVYENLSNLYYVMGDYDNALKATRQWIVLSQGNYRSWLFLASIYQAMNQSELQMKAREDAFFAAPSIELRNSISTTNSNVSPVPSEMTK